MPQPRDLSLVAAEAMILPGEPHAAGVQTLPDRLPDELALALGMECATPHLWLAQPPDERGARR